jgi:hypothetical protein
VFPNPFSPSKAVGHTLKFDNLPPDSDVRIFTLSGELVVEFPNASGRTLWDAKNVQGADVASGIYIYIVTMPGRVNLTGKIFLVR